MTRNKELILPLIIALLLLIVPLWLLGNYLTDFLFYQKLSSSGTNATARLNYKYIVTHENWLRNYFINDSTENYKFIVGYKTADFIWTKCEIGVSKDTYYSISIRDQLGIVYDSDSPTQCTLPDGIEINRILLLVSIIFAVFLMIIGICFLIYIYKSFKKPPPDKYVTPTTNMNIEQDGPRCIKCNNLMVEGYMPTVGGVSWRNRDEPIGIPTIFSGLPGTTFWIKRPLLHAYHCTDCKIIIFKYGKEK